MAQFVQGDAFALQVFFGGGGAVGQADGGPFKRAEQQIGIDQHFFLDRQHAGPLDHGFQQGRAEVGRHFGHLRQVQLWPVDAAIGLLRQEMA